MNAREWSAIGVSAACALVVISGVLYLLVCLCRAEDVRGSDE